MENSFVIEKPFEITPRRNEAAVAGVGGSEPLISVKGMAMSYGGKHAHAGVNVLEGVDLDIREGEFHILLGPSGCGKSTLLNIIAGFLKSTGGSVLMHGRAITRPGRDRGLIFQNADSAIFP
ncbi:MAG: ATP-binding cassette domain-containing protein, partial [Synergistaceae bacterium]|nr:ATP-binding cassette domain-containing protein [Synergistaceae bacterium]